MTENTELEFFETSAQSGMGVTEVRRLNMFLPLVTQSHTSIPFRKDLHLYSSVDAENSHPIPGSLFL